MINNNRQAGRRRGRGGQRQGGSPAGNGNGNRIDNRARGNANQLYEKYKMLAADAQRQGDRVNTEYYLQFADHYFRVLAETRSRFEEQNPQARRGREEAFDDEDEGFDDDDGGEGETMPSRDDGGDRFDRGQRDDRPQRDSRPQREDRPQQRDDRPQQRDDRPQREDRPQQRDDRPQQRDDRPQRDNREQRPNREFVRAQRDDRGDRPPHQERAERPQQQQQERAEPLARAANDEELNGAAPAEREAPRRGRPRRDARPPVAASEGEAFDAALLPPALGIGVGDEGEPAKPRRGRPRRVVTDQAPDAAE